jgi:hypothetical protein
MLFWTREDDGRVLHTRSPLHLCHEIWSWPPCPNTAWRPINSRIKNRGKGVQDYDKADGKY